MAQAAEGTAAKPRPTLHEATRPSLIAAHSPGAGHGAGIENPKVGDRVAVGTQQMKGTVRFFGSTNFSAGDWAGIELDDPHGKNDGSVKGIRYFECEAAYGLFVRPTALMKIKQIGAIERPSTMGIDHKAISQLVDGNLEKRNSAEDVPKPAGRRSVRISEVTEEIPALEQLIGPAAASKYTSDQQKGLQAVHIDDGSDYDDDEEKPHDTKKRSSLENVDSLDWSTVGSSQPPVSDSKAAANTEVNRLSGSSYGSSLPSTSNRKALPSNVAEVQRELADAVEDHDIEKIRRLLPQATILGVAPEELETAQNILNFEVQQTLLDEIEDVRAAVRGLRQAVHTAENRAAAVEKAARRGVPGVAPKKAKGTVPAGDKGEAWIAQVGQKLEERVWAGLERRLEDAIHFAVTRATAQLVAAAQQVRELRAPANGHAERRPSLRTRPGELEQEDRLRPGDLPDSPVRKREPQRGPATQVTSSQLASVCLRGVYRSAVASTSASPSSPSSPVRRSLASICLGSAYQTAASSSAAQASRSSSSSPVRRSLASICLGSVYQTTASNSASQASPSSSSSPARRSLASICLGSVYQTTASNSAAQAGGDIDEIDLIMQRMDASRRGAEAQMHKATTRIQAAERGRLARKEYPRSQVCGKALSASQKIQLAVRKWQSRRQHDSIRDIASAAKALRRKHAAWAAFFDSHIVGGQVRIDATAAPGLTEAAFIAALNDAHASVSVRQASALWEGYTEGTGKAGVDMKGFCSICEAVAVGADAAAEFADISIEEYVALRDEPEATMNCTEEVRSIIQKPGASSAIQKLQRAIRRRAARRKLDGDDALSLSMAVKVSRSRHQAWAGIYDDACNGDGGLSLDSFGSALCEIHPNLSSGQVSALWNGFVSGTGKDIMDIVAFCAITEAVFIGDDAAAEFADISMEAFQALASRGGESAATRIQAIYRGSIVRKSVNEGWGPPAAVAVSKKRSSRELSPPPTFAVSVVAAPPAEVNPIAHLLAGTALPSAPSSPPKFPGSPSAKPRVAARPSPSSPVPLRQLSANRDRDFIERHSASVSPFREAERKENSTCGIAEVQNFEVAILQILPRLSQAQVRALWDGFIENTDFERMPLADFCLMVEAGTSDEELSEFADMAPEAFRRLGSPELEAREEVRKRLREDMSREIADRSIRASMAKASPSSPSSPVRRSIASICLGSAYQTAARKSVDQASPSSPSSPVRRSIASICLGSAYQTAARKSVDQATPASSSRAAANPVSSEESQAERARSAATILQRMARRWRARRQATGGMSFAAAAHIVRARHHAWAEIFDTASRGRGGLDEGSLGVALKEVHPRLSGAQVSAMWRFHVEAAEEDLVDLKTFCSMLEAVSIGDDAACDFADMSPEDFTALAAQ